MSTDFTMYKKGNFICSNQFWLKSVWIAFFSKEWKLLKFINWTATRISFYWKIFRVNDSNLIFICFKESLFQLYPTSATLIRETVATVYFHRDIFLPFILKSTQYELTYSIALILYLCLYCLLLQLHLTYRFCFSHHDLPFGFKLETFPKCIHNSCNNSMWPMKFILLGLWEALHLRHRLPFCVGTQDLG